MSKKPLVRVLIVCAIVAAVTVSALLSGCKTQASPQGTAPSATPNTGLPSAVPSAPPQTATKPPATGGQSNATPPTGGPSATPQVITAPVPKGQKLVPLSQPPGRTIGALKIGQVPKQATYKVVIRPFGYGPTALQGTTIVARIDSINPVGKEPLPGYLRESNMVMVMLRDVPSKLNVGGTYQGTLTFVVDGQRLVPVLSSVTAQ